MRLVYAMIPVVLLCESGHERERAINEAVLAAASVTKPLATEELRDMLGELVPWTAITASSFPAATSCEPLGR